MFYHYHKKIKIPESEIPRLEEQAREIFGSVLCGYKLREYMETLYDIEKNGRVKFKSLDTSLLFKQK